MKKTIPVFDHYYSVQKVFLHSLEPPFAYRPPLNGGWRACFLRNGLAGAPFIGGGAGARGFNKDQRTFCTVHYLSAWVLLGVLWILPLKCLTQVNKMDMQAFTISDGLPDNAIMTLLQDRQGFIWAGTINGLAKGVILFDPTLPKPTGHTTIRMRIRLL